MKTMNEVSKMLQAQLSNNTDVNEICRSYLTIKSKWDYMLNDDLYVIAYDMARSTIMSILLNNGVASDVVCSIANEDSILGTMFVTAAHGLNERIKMIGYQRASEKVVDNFIGRYQVTFNVVINR